MINFNISLPEQCFSRDKTMDGDYGDYYKLLPFLPFIRKTGGYGVEGNLATVLENQRIMMRSMQSLWLYLSTRDACSMSFSKEIAKHEMR